MEHCEVLSTLVGSVFIHKCYASLRNETDNTLAYFALPSGMKKKSLKIW
jgi:hypothetical protein